MSVCGSLSLCKNIKGDTSLRQSCEQKGQSSMRNKVRCTGAHTASGCCGRAWRHLDGSLLANELCTSKDGEHVTIADLALSPGLLRVFPLDIQSIWAEPFLFVNHFLFFSITSYLLPSNFHQALVISPQLLKERSSAVQILPDAQ